MSYKNTHNTHTHELVQTFHIMGEDVPDDYGRVPPDVWKQSIGLTDHKIQDEEDPSLSSSSSSSSSSSVFCLLPSPAFQNSLDDFLRGLESVFPSSKVFGAIASTVSSLSRARLFRFDANDDCIQTLADGCVGVAMTGDIQIKTMIAQGTKPVGGIYQIVKGDDTTIRAIALDETATEFTVQAEVEEQETDTENVANQEAKNDVNARMKEAYAKARIPKPPLAEANFIMRTISDDDQAFMRKALLIGLERAGSIGRTPNELARLAEGKGHRFDVHRVASAGMKDGSVTFSLGSVNIQPGTRMRFFVRESTFAKKEVEALWMGYKRRILTETLQGAPTFTPTGCFLFPTLDRGSKFFPGKPGFESGAVSQFLPTVPCVTGFFNNGVIGALEADVDSGLRESASVHGSASGYVLLGSST